jgi:hypothetical protein
MNGKYQKQHIKTLFLNEWDGPVFGGQGRYAHFSLVKDKSYRRD